MSRRLSLESMEGRLMLSGTDLDTSVFNLDDIAPSFQAIVGSDADDPGTLAFDRSPGLSDAIANYFLSADSALVNNGTIEVAPLAVHQFNPRGAALFEGGLAYSFSDSLRTSSEPIFDVNDSIDSGSAAPISVPIDVVGTLDVAIGSHSALETNVSQQQSTIVGGLVPGAMVHSEHVAPAAAVVSVVPGAQTVQPFGELVTFALPGSVDAFAIPTDPTSSPPEPADVVNDVVSDVVAGELLASGRHAETSVELAAPDAARVTEDSNRREGGMIPLEFVFAAFDAESMARSDRVAATAAADVTPGPVLAASGLSGELARAVAFESLDAEEAAPSLVRGAVADSDDSTARADARFTLASFASPLGSDDSAADALPMVGSLTMSRDSALGASPLLVLLALEHCVSSKRNAESTRANALPPGRRGNR